MPRCACVVNVCTVRADPCACRAEYCTSDLIPKQGIALHSLPPCLHTPNSISSFTSLRPWQAFTLAVCLQINVLLTSVACFRRFSRSRANEETAVALMASVHGLRAMPRQIQSAYGAAVLSCCHCCGCPAVWPIIDKGEHKSGVEVPGLRVTIKDSTAHFHGIALFFMLLYPHTEPPWNLSGCALANDNNNHPIFRVTETPFF